jgi:hypothetical protein
MKTWGLFRILAPVMLLGALAGASLEAQPLGTLFAGTGRNDGGRIITINKTTGVGTVVGSSGFTEVSALTFSSSGILYGATGGSQGPSFLVTVNTSTGVATSIGPLTPSSSGGFAGLAFHSSGTHFGAAWNGSSGELWTINPSNAAQTFVAAVTGCTGNNFATGIVFSSGGTLFGSRGGSGGHVENLVTLNPATAACTAIGSGSSNNITDIAFDPFTGILYGVTGGGSSVLLQIDPVTGAETLIGPIGIPYVSALAINGAAAVVPTLSEWAMIAMGALLAVAGFVALYLSRPRVAG